MISQNQEDTVSLKTRIRAAFNCTFSATLTQLIDLFQNGPPGGIFSLSAPNFCGFLGAAMDYCLVPPDSITEQHVELSRLICFALNSRRHRALTSESFKCWLETMNSEQKLAVSSWLKSASALYRFDWRKDEAKISYLSGWHAFDIPEIDIVAVFPPLYPEDISEPVFIDPSDLRLVEQINAVFSLLPFPAETMKNEAEKIGHGYRRFDQFCALQIFKGRAWADISSDEIAQLYSPDGFSDLFALLSSEAKHYYFPAGLRICLEVTSSDAEYAQETRSSLQDYFEREKFNLSAEEVKIAQSILQNDILSSSQ